MPADLVREHERNLITGLLKITTKALYVEGKE